MHHISWADRAPTLTRWLSARVVLALCTLTVWSAVAYSAVGWWLRDVPSTALSVDPATQRSTALGASPEAIDTPAVARALGATAPTVQAAPTLASRLQLIGVINGEGQTSVALISVDGKPAKPFPLGKPVTDGLVLQSTQAKRVHLGASVDGPSTLSLDLPVKK